VKTISRIGIGNGNHPSYFVVAKNEDLVKKPETRVAKLGSQIIQPETTAATVFVNLLMAGESAHAFIGTNGWPNDVMFFDPVVMESGF